MIFKRRHKSDFTIITNKLFDDERLAADEVGILAYLLSRPSNWEVRRPALMRRWDIGIVAMKRIVHSWMRTGWCHARKVRLTNGRFLIVYEISDLPGRELSQDEIREALSLVSSEASTDESGSEYLLCHPDSVDPPPLCQPVLDDHPLVGRGVAYKDITNTELTRTDSNKIDGIGDAREPGKSQFTQGSKALASAFWKALGFDQPIDIPPEFAGVDWRAVQWERAGWTTDLIDAEGRRIARDKPLKPLSYFEKVFATAFAKRQAPLPVVEVGGPIRAFPIRPLTEFQRGRQELKGILNDLNNFASGSGQGSGDDPRLLPGNTGERSNRICEGPGENTIDLPPSSYREGG